MIELKQDQEVIEEANKVIREAKKCTERGEGRGTAHVFLDNSMVCECGAKDLSKYRMNGA